MELRHLDTLLAIAEEGSFTAAADALNTVQSNVSDQMRQLEHELGVPLLVRGRRGAEPTEFGAVVLERARRVQRELEAMRADLSMLQGLEAGHARLGVVGTASRWLVPALVADLRVRAPGVRLRVNEGASERLLAEVIEGELAQAVVTEPVDDRRLVVEHLLDEALVALVHADVPLPAEPVPLAALTELPLVLPPARNPLRIELESVAASQDLTLEVAGGGRGHPPDRRPRRRRRLRVDPPGDRDPARSRDLRAVTIARCRRVGSRSSTRATRSSRSPTRRSATA